MGRGEGILRDYDITGDGTFLFPHSERLALFGWLGNLIHYYLVFFAAFLRRCLICDESELSGRSGRSGLIWERKKTNTSHLFILQSS